jgi:hypothetical protein
MKDLTQLFRFLIPGGFFIIYYFLFSPLFGFEYSDFIESIKNISAIYIFLIPALGYFFSTIHHLSYNSFPCYRVKLKGVEDGNYQKDWAKYNVRWRKQSYKDIYAEFNNRNNSLTDLMHGNGANLFSLILAVLVLAIRALISDHVLVCDCKNIISYSAILIVLLVVHISSYIVSKKHSKEYVEKAIEELEKPEKHKKRTVSKKQRK